MRRDALAIDIGGTKVAIAVVTADGGVVEERRFSTPHGRALAAVDEILGWASELAAQHPVVTCGIVLPAVIEQGRIAWAAATIAGWDGVRLRERANERLEIPVVAEFDGYGATLGEWWQGSARGYDDAAVVIVGTGVGAGVIHAGHLYRGVSAIAGGIGWFRFPNASTQGPRLEDLASGPAILAHARRLNGGDATAYPDTRAVFAAAEAGDRAAHRAVERGLRALAAGVGAIVALLAPEVVVLGGSVGARPDTVARVRELIKDSTQPFAAQTVKIEGSSLGPLSSLYGAAYLAHQLDQGKEP